MTRRISSIAVFAAFALCLAVMGAIDGGAGKAQAQAQAEEFVDVGLTLEVPSSRSTDLTHVIDIIVVNHGTMTAYDVEVVVDIRYPEDSSYFLAPGDYHIQGRTLEVPVGSVSQGSDIYSLRWSIPALGGLQRETLTPSIIHKTPETASVQFDSSLYPHEFFGQVTASSFESNLHKGNNTSRVWSYQSGEHNFRPVAGNYAVTVSVDDASPSPGGTVNFTITAGRANVHAGDFFPPPIDLKVDIDLTGGLSVSGTPTFASTTIIGQEQDVPDSVSYGNGVFTIGTLKTREPTENSVALPFRVSSSAVVNEQCLTATLTGKPPPGTGPDDDDISDNVAKVCLGQIPPYFTSADLHEFVSHPCVGDSNHPCDNTDDVRVRAIYAATDPPVILGPGVPVIFVPDNSATRQYDGNTKSVNGENVASWQTTVQIGYEPYASEHERWGAITHNLAYEMIGKVGAFDKLHVRPAWGANDIFLNNEQRNADLFSFSPGASGSNGPYDMTAEFEKLGTYKMEYTVTTTHDNNTSDDTSDDVEYTATGSYIFHVGPMTDLEVRDGGSSPHAAADRNALAIIAVNNSSIHSPVARVTGLPTGAEVIHISHGSYDGAAGEWDIGELRVRDYYRSAGESEPTLVLGASAGDTLNVSIASSENYEVCVGPKDNPGNLPYTTRAACEAVTSASWNSTPVYDYNADNNEAKVEARRGTDELPEGAPAHSERADDAVVIVEWTVVETVNAYGVTHYEVWRQDDDDDPWERVERKVGINQWLDWRVTPRESYNYRVRAVNLAGVPGPWSRVMELAAISTQQTTPTTSGAPDKPVLTAAASGRTQIDLTWEMPTENGSPITSYTIEVADSANGPWSVPDPAPELDRDDTSWTHTGLNGGTTSHYRLLATNSQGDSPWSNVASATTDRPSQAGAPVNVLARGASGADAGSVIVVTWQPPESDGGRPLTGYEVQWSPNGTGGWRTAGRVDADTLSFEDTGLDWGTTRYYRVAARNSVGIGPWSDPPTPGSTAEQDQGEGVSVPGAPTNLRLTPGNSHMIVAWNAPASDGGSPIRGYRVMYRHRDPDRGKTGAWQAWQELSHFTADTSVTMTGMYNHVEYQVKVAAVNGVGTSLYTPVATGIYDPQWVPGEPPNVEFEPGDGRIKVTWREPWNLGNPQLTGYRVQYRVDGSADWLPATPYSVGRSARSYTITGLTNCTTYQVQVWAVNAEGDSPKAGADGKLKATPQKDCPGNVHSLTNPRLSPDNQPPTADAGPDQSVNEGDTVTLAGSGTDPEGQTLTYAWTAPEGITLSSSTAASPTFTAPDRTEGYTLTFSLVVNDGSSDSAVDTVDISVTVSDDGDEQDGAGGEGGADGAGGEGKADNQPPTADAGPDQSVNEGDTVTLAGAGSDPEGQTLTYAWTAPEGITLSDATAANPTFIAPERTEDYTLTFSLVVNDGSSDSAADTVDVSVSADNDVPGTPSVTDQAATVGTAFSYQFAEVTDPEGATPTYTALQVDSDGMTSELPDWLAFDAGTRTFSCAASGDGACEAGALTVRVMASDGASPTPATSYADFTLTVSAAESTNSPPSFDQSSYAFDLVENADGSGVDAAIALGAVSATDPDSGDTVEYSITDGNDGGLFAIDSSSGVITYTGAGENFEGFIDDPDVSDDGPAFAYTLTVQASDGKASVTVPVTIRVTDVDEPPTASAGPDQAVTEGVTVTLAGLGSDLEAQTLIYAWVAPPTQS